MCIAMSRSKSLSTRGNAKCRREREERGKGRQLRERVCMCVLHLTRRIGHLKVGCTSSLTRCTAREGLEVAANMSGNAVLSRPFLFI